MNRWIVYQRERFPLGKGAHRRADVHPGEQGGLKKPGIPLIAALGRVLSGLDASAKLAGRKVEIYSEGVRISGLVLYPQALEGKKLPAVILSHGWGGTAAMLRPQAERFAQAGYFVLVVDYRGWGDSDGRWVRDESGSGANARRELREVVDPIDQSTDLFNAVHSAAATHAHSVRALIRDRRRVGGGMVRQSEYRRRVARASGPFRSENAGRAPTPL